VVFLALNRVSFKKETGFIAKAAAYGNKK